MKEGAKARVRFILIISAILFLTSLPLLGSGAELTVVPNSTQYMVNRTFNFTVNNTDPAVNITDFYLHQNSSFYYVTSTNGTSAQNTGFYGEFNNIVRWYNLTPGALIENGTSEAFWLNLTMPAQTGLYTFTANLTYANGTNETKTFNITINCSQELVPEIYLPQGEGYPYGGPVPFYGRVLDACGFPVEDANVIYSIYKLPNMYNRTNTNPTHNSTGQWSEDSGWYNFTWSGTDAERSVGWYNLTFYASRSGYPDNYTYSEDAFILRYQPSLSGGSVSRTSTCPEGHQFSVTVSDADNDYNNVTLEARRWNGSGWDNWSLANWTYQNSQTPMEINFYQNFSNTSFPAGLYSYRFYTTDQYNFTDSLPGPENFTINNCTDILSITTTSPTPSNGSYSPSGNLTINMTFVSANAVNCTLSFNNGTTSNYTDNASKGWCNFSLPNQPEGLHNYSVWINNTYGNTFWNGTWFLGVDLTDPENLTFVSPTTPNSTSPINQDWIYVNVTLDESNPSYCTLVLENGTAQNHTMSGLSNSFLNITGLPDGIYNYSVYCFDLSGRFVSNGTQYASLDIAPPNITANILNLSQSNVTYNISSLPSSLQVTTSEAADSCWFTINSTNETIMTNSSQTSWSSPLSLQCNGTYVLNISCNDTAGNLNATNITFNYDSTTPPCTENWSYSAWGPCIGNLQYRTATDLNDCGTYDNRSYLSMSCGGGDGGGGGGGAAAPVGDSETKVWGTIMPEMRSTMSITKDTIPVTSVGFQVTQTVKGVSIKVERIDEPGNPMNISSDQKIYHYINITQTNLPEETVRNVSIEFCVTHSWLSNNSVSKETVKLRRLYGGTWQTLLTNLVSDDSSKACYASSSPGFSYFAITGDIVFVQPFRNETVSNETTPYQPGEEIQDGEEPLPPGSVCRPKERACVGWSVLQECNPEGTGWLTVTECFYGCSNAQCNTHLVISIDYSIFWSIMVLILILALVWVLHAKKRAIENFLFWKL